jgi:hypothetical protein
MTALSFVHQRTAIFSDVKIHMERPVQFCVTLATSLELLWSCVVNLKDLSGIDSPLHAKSAWSSIIVLEHPADHAQNLLVIQVSIGADAPQKVMVCVDRAKHPSPSIQCGILSASGDAIRAILK